MADAGAVEIELAKDIDTIREKCAGLDHHPIRKFVQALDALPKQLAGNAGLKVRSYWNNYFIRFIRADLCAP